MKKVSIAATFILVFAAAVSSFGQAKVGGFLGYGSDVEQLGIGGIADFSLNDKWSVSPSLLFYFPEKNGNIKVSYYEFNINGNYHFYNSGSADVYALGGLNYFHAKVKNTSTDQSVSGDEVGLNIGIGSNFDIGKNWQPFGEAKFVIGDADQLALFFGVKFKL